MTIDTTYPTAPPRPRRAPRSRKAPAHWGRRRRMEIPRRRASRRFQLLDASMALNTLMQEGDLFKVDRNQYLVALVRPDLLDVLVMASAATEDDEDEEAGGNDLSPGDADDAEEDDPGGGNVDDEGHDDGISGEGESSLGWADTGPQTRLDAGYSGGMIREGDGNCDDEEDNEDLSIDDLPHDDIGMDIEVSFTGIHDAKDRQILATAKQRWRAKRSSTIDHGDGQLYSVTYDVSGCRILTPIPPIVIGKLGGAA